MYISVCVCDCIYYYTVCLHVCVSIFGRLTKCGLFCIDLFFITGLAGESILAWSFALLFYDHAGFDYRFLFFSTIHHRRFLFFGPSYFPMEHIEYCL